MVIKNIDVLMLISLSCEVLSEVKSNIFNKIKFSSSKSKANQCDIAPSALLAQSAVQSFQCLLNNMVPISSAQITAGN